MYVRKNMAYEQQIIIKGIRKRNVALVLVINYNASKGFMYLPLAPCGHPRPQIMRVMHVNVEKPLDQLSQTYLSIQLYLEILVKICYECI